MFAIKTFTSYEPVQHSELRGDIVQDSLLLVNKASDWG